MDIETVIVPPDIIEKIKVKHKVDWWEAQEAFFNDEHPPFTRKSQGKYAAYGRTYDGRYLMVGFIFRKKKVAVVRTARDMTERERRYYQDRS